MLGVLSALPLISGANLCCCLWLITGGVVAAYVLQQNQSTPIAPADGALVGLFAGLIGAVVYLVLSLPMAYLMAPFERRLFDWLESIGNLPADVRAYATSPGAIGLRTVASFVLILFLGAIFSTLGGLLGAVIFGRNKKTIEKTEN